MVPSGGSRVALPAPISLSLPETATYPKVVELGRRTSRGPDLTRWPTRRRVETQKTQYVENFKRATFMYYASLSLAAQYEHPPQRFNPHHSPRNLCDRGTGQIKGFGVSETKDSPIQMGATVQPAAETAAPFFDPRLDDAFDHHQLLGWTAATEEPVIESFTDHRPDLLAECEPRISRLPLIYVMSRGNRDGRPIFARHELEQMGYAGCIEAQIIVLTAFDANMKALQELRSTGAAFTGLSEGDTVSLRKGIEDLFLLGEYYEIERDTVEK